MLLPSSLPAQAASAIGSNSIAANFADVPKRNCSTCPVLRILLDRPAAKWNSHLGYQSRIKHVERKVPAHGQWGSNGAWAGSDTRRRCGGNGDMTAPAGISFSRAWRARLA